MAVQNVDARSAFKFLIGLVGRWVTAPGSASPHEVTYTQHAKDFALLEHWRLGPTSDALTLYHVVDGVLWATHYCPHGNQAVLQFSIESTSSTFTFRTADATAAAAGKMWRQVEFALTFDKREGFVRSEAYAGEGRIEWSQWRYLRQDLRQ